MRLPALEKNILVYRALQMTLLLFHAEELKRTLIGSVGPKIREETEKNPKGGKLLEAIFQHLVREQILTESESIELQDLIEYRNYIAHQIHQLTGDIEVPGKRNNLRNFLMQRYDYGALIRAKKWAKTLWRRLGRNYCLVFSFDPLLFEVAEKAYEDELKRLRQRIDRQIAIRKRKTGERRLNKASGATSEPALESS